VIKQRPEHVAVAAVAKEVGVSVRTIHRWERGESEPSISQWMAYILASDIHASLAFHIELNAALDKKHLDE